MFPTVTFRSLSLFASRRTMATRPASWKSAAPLALNNSTTFAAQPKLPRLPLADLDTSLSKLKISLRPLAWNGAEYAAAEKKIDDFVKSGKAAELHARLLKHAEGKSHWLEEWWDDMAYLGYRDSVRFLVVVAKITVLSVFFSLTKLGRRERILLLYDHSAVETMHGV
jgi:Choline/Carnitine o-acyltransferase